jgi:hypothetical protein
MLRFRRPGCTMAGMPRPDETPSYVESPTIPAGMTAGQYRRSRQYRRRHLFRRGSKAGGDSADAGKSEKRAEPAETT